MPITIDGTGSISVLSAGGLPDLSVQTADIADGAVTPAKRSEDLTRATAQTASTTVVDFTGIPSWARRITVILDQISGSGTSNFLVRLGTASGIVSTGYQSSSTWGGTAAGSTAGFLLRNQGAAVLHNGTYTFLSISGNTWVGSGVLRSGSSDTGVDGSCSGRIALADTLTQLRITTVNGTDTFDAGTINIMYE